MWGLGPSVGPRFRLLSICVLGELACRGVHLSCRTQCDNCGCLERRAEEKITNVREDQMVRQPRPTLMQEEPVLVSRGAGYVSEHPVPDTPGGKTNIDLHPRRPAPLTHPSPTDLMVMTPTASAQRSLGLAWDVGVYKSRCVFTRRDAALSWFECVHVYRDMYLRVLRTRGRRGHGTTSHPIDVARYGLNIVSSRVESRECLRAISAAWHAWQPQPLTVSQWWTFPQAPLFPQWGH